MQNYAVLRVKSHGFGCFLYNFFAKCKEAVMTGHQKNRIVVFQSTATAREANSSGKKAGVLGAA